MNKDDIKKALEFCADAFPCEGCAYHDDLMCTDKLKTDALNVIIEQEQEIERLKAATKQAKIAVLSELKENAVEIYSKEFGQMEFVGVDAIDELIKEVEE